MFSKGLVYGFGKKLAIFPIFYVIEYRREKGVF